MTRRRRLIFTVVILAAIASVAVCMTLVTLYNTSFEQQRLRLIEAAQSQARLIEAVASYNLQHYLEHPTGPDGQDYSEAEHIQMAFEATMSQINEAHRGFKGIGKSGEFTLARREADQIVFLLSHRHYDLADLKPVPFESIEAEPMRRALKGVSGTMVGLDYRGETVLAAYEPVAGLSLGIVAKIDLAEIRAPFIRAGALVAVVVLALLITGILFSFRVGNPLVEELTENASRFRQISANIPGAIYQFVMHRDNSFSIPFGTDGFARLSGVPAAEFVERPARIFEIVHLDDLTRFNQSIYDSAETMQTWDCDFRIVTAGGSIRLIHGKSFPQRIKNGDILWNGVLLDITERKQAEEALRESESRYRALIDSLPVGIYRSTPKGQVISASPALLRILGYETEDEYTDRPAVGSFVEASRRAEFIAALVEKGSVSNFESQKVRKDGSVVWISTSAKAVLGENGQIEYIDGIEEDITERKRAEEALQESEERYKKLFFEAPVSYQSLDEDGNFLEVNETWCKTLGYQREEIIGRNFAEFIDPDYSDVFARCFPKFKGAGSINGVEFNMVKKDGSRIVASFVGRVGRNSDHSFKQTHCIFTDVTERKRAEEALRESEGKFRSLAENSQDYIMRFDREYRHLYKNPAALSISEHQETDIIGKTHREIGYVQDYCDQWERNLERVFSAGKSIQYTFEWDNVAGNRFLEWRLFPEADPDGRIYTALAVGRDITETKRLQEQESRAQRLETAGRIAGQVAHDFNNLLAPLMAYPDFIRESLPGNHPSLAYLDDIENSAQKIADINQQLLTLGRRGHYNQEILNLNTIIHQAANEMKPLPPTLVCDLELCPDLMNVQGGGAQIHRVFINLLSNARDAMHDIGQVLIKTENYYVDEMSLAYSRVPKGEYVKVTISDTGSGIPEDQIQKIFDPFFTSKTTDKKRGSGLGLSIVDAVVKDHGGYVDLVTKVGHGSSFYIYFPVSHKSSNPQDDTRRKNGTESIMVVDDDQMQREVSSKLLEKLGYSVTVAESGERAVKLLKSQPHDLVILDMVMPPGIDGAETYRQILENNPGQRAIIVSGFSETGRIMEAQSLGAGAFVRKPLTKKAISGAVRRELDREVQIEVS